MPDGDPRNRFANAREEYDQSSPDQQDDTDEKDSTASKEHNDSKESQDSMEHNDSTGGTTSMKAQRKSVQMYVPEDDKGSVERTWRDVETLANLADVEKPAKNDYYAALLRYGYNDLEQIARDIGLADAYAEYGGVIE
jgi:hypothetical protein